MKDVHELLREKEMDYARLQREIEALRLVIPLLIDEECIPESVGQEQESVAPETTGTEGPVSSPLGRTGWSFWKRRREN